MNGPENQSQQERNDWLHIEFLTTGASVNFASKSPARNGCSRGCGGIKCEPYVPFIGMVLFESRGGATLRTAPAQVVRFSWRWLTSHQYGTVRWLWKCVHMGYPAHHPVPSPKFGHLYLG